ncbi:hypothetical protein MXB_4280 [Myxobolus squamalis]|nr:hypothetical protein MXB_4280 [Myxobolus squamalis]
MQGVSLFPVCICFNDWKVRANVLHSSTRTCRVARLSLDVLIKNAIKFIKIYAMLNYQCWSGFWVYFSCIWMAHFSSDIWSIYNIDNKQLAGRTSNCLER